MDGSIVQIDRVSEKSLIVYLFLLLWNKHNLKKNILFHEYVLVYCKDIFYDVSTIYVKHNIILPYYRVIKFQHINHRYNLILSIISTPK